MQGKQKKKSSFPDRRLSMFLPKIKKIKRKKKSYKMQLVRARGFISVSSLFVLCSVKLQKKKE